MKNFQFNNKEINKIIEFQRGKDSAILAILFTDIVNYSKFVENEGNEEAVLALQDYDYIFINLIKKNNAGIIIKKIGDSFLSVFTEPHQAALVALQFQQQLFNNKKINNQLKTRIGIHLGQVIFDNTFSPDIFGNHINIASRIMSIAHGNQILVSSSIFENSIGWLKQKNNKKLYKFRILGNTQLKGIKQKYKLYELYNANIGTIGLPQVFKKNIIKLLSLTAIAISLSLYSFFVLNTKYNNITEEYIGNIVFFGLSSDSKYMNDIKQLYGPRFNYFKNINSSNVHVISENEINQLNREITNHLSQQFYPKRIVYKIEDYKELIYEQNLLITESFIDDMPFLSKLAYDYGSSIFSNPEAIQDSLFEKSNNTKEIMKKLDLQYIFGYNVYKIPLINTQDSTYLYESSIVSFNGDSAKIDMSYIVKGASFNIVESVKNEIFELVYGSNNKFAGKVIALEKDNQVMIKHFDSLTTIPTNITLGVSRLYQFENVKEQRISDLNMCLNSCNNCNDDMKFWLNNEIEMLNDNLHPLLPVDLSDSLFYLEGILFPIYQEIKIIKTNNNNSIGIIIDPNSCFKIQLNDKVQLN